MKTIPAFILCALVAMPFSSSATWQMASPERTGIITSSQVTTTVPRELVSHPAYWVYLHKDLLYKNVVRMAKQYNWKVVWKAPYRDWILTSAEVGGPTFESVMNQVLENYSVRAIYDNTNNTVTIIPAKKTR